MNDEQNQNDNETQAEQAPELESADKTLSESKPAAELKPAPEPNPAPEPKPDNDATILPETNAASEPKFSANETIAESIKTSMLSLDEALPMEQREPRPNTAHLSLGWRIVFKIGDQKKTLPMKEMIMIGRAVESDSTASQLNFDLTAYGAYHFGVSRNHAQMTLKDGYLYLEDLDSTNGTRINGFQLTANQKYRLRDGDEIEFARLRTVIQFKGPDTP